LGLTKMLPGGKKSASPFTVELKVDGVALRALDISSQKVCIFVVRFLPSVALILIGQTFRNSGVFLIFPS
jgi:hypothetical protein